MLVVAACYNPHNSDESGSLLAIAACYNPQNSDESGSLLAVAAYYKPNYLPILMVHALFGNGNW